MKNHNKKKKNRTIQFNILFVLSLILILIIEGCSGCSESRNKVPELKNPRKTEIIDSELEKGSHSNSDIQKDDLELANHPASSTILRVVSLKKFIKEAKLNPQSEDIENFFGLGWIEGYVIDSVHNDILIYGREVKNWPNITIFDFIENLKNAYQNKQAPYCSLDPRNENILQLNKYLNQQSIDIDLCKVKNLLGEQMSVIGGVPFKSRHALVMLDADYHMKKVSQGLIRLPNVLSYLDYALEEQDNSGGYSRFWFRYAENSPKYINEANILEIHECKIIVSTNSMEASSSGDLADVDKDDSAANNFAERFSEHFHSSAQYVECYADLENLYRLQALVRAMRQYDLFTGHQSIFNYFLNEYPVTQTYKVPESYEGLADKMQSTNGDFVCFVMGGVSMTPGKPKWNYQGAPTNTINRKGNVIIKHNSNDKPSFIIDMKERDLLDIIIFRYNNLFTFYNLYRPLYQNAA
ncbi:MAG: DUF1598 domain-containing protein [Bacteroidales bacterium]|nr:DUF1598 domain-containing protein [Bacteroidales bacterium]